jgi:glutamine amidotransferase
MLTIINYGVGNLTSILNMHKRIGVDAIVTADIDEIKKADRIILPGVGHFDKCMQNFNASGMRPVIEEIAAKGNVPILGICVGAQMMTKGSEEGTEPGLGWVDAMTVRFRKEPDETLRIPHMGWADIKVVPGAPLWSKLPADPRFYFAHSYHFQFGGDDLTIARCHHGYDYTCAFQKQHIFGVQFHPEKSHRFGMDLLTGFSTL